MDRATLPPLLLLTLLSVSFAAYCPGIAVYKVTFQGEWGSDESSAVEAIGPPSDKATESAEQSRDFPQEARFSPFAFASHSLGYVMWRPENKASEEVQEIAEKGNNSLLLKEIETKKSRSDEIGYVNSVKNEIPANGHFTTYVATNTFFPFVSFVSRLTPSPDWFIGAYHLHLCMGVQMKWFPRRTLNLYAWDAGTDDGKNFTAADDPTDPPTNITLLKRSDDKESSFHVSDGDSEYIPRFATIEFELVNVTYDEVRECKALGNQVYKFQFIGLWTEEHYPHLKIPENASFSMAIATSHSSKFVLWAPYTVDDEGDDSDVEYAISSFEQTDHIAAGGYSEAFLNVNNDFHYISASAKLTPSPDWYTGISSINVCDGHFWKDEIEIYVQPWDAGTHDGVTFVGEHNETIPRGKITPITTDTPGPFFDPARQHAPYLAIIKLERIKDPQKDYETFLQTWKVAMNNYQDEFEKWEAEECGSK